MNWKNINLIKRTLVYPFKLLYLPFAFIAGAILTDFTNEYGRKQFSEWMAIFYKF